MPCAYLGGRGSGGPDRPFCKIQIYLNYTLKLPEICFGHPPPLPGQTQITVEPPPPPPKHFLDPRMLVSIRYALTF